MPDDNFYARVVADILEDIVRAAARIAGQQLMRLYRTDLTAYLANTLQNSSRVKTILHPDAAVELKSLYVKTTFVSDEEVWNDESLIKKLSALKRVVIIGTAGSGKSMFMRFLFNRLFVKGALQIPLLIEMRRLNSQDQKSQDKKFITFVYETIKNRGARLTVEQFTEGLARGTFLLILDGLDEVDLSIRASIDENIVELAETHPDLTIVISSRPDDCFDTWDQFTSFHVQPMDRNQTIDLINRVEYDKTIKQAFIKDLKGNLFEKHKSFLSNPLLTFLMLLTYDLNTGIPDRLHTFYASAFDRMFRRRVTRTALGFDEFRNLLARLCFETFKKGDISFPEIALREIAKASITMEAATAVAGRFNTVDPNQFINELIANLCILQRDGVFVEFSHKSLQEYFVAFFAISRMRPQTLVEFLDSCCQRRDDNIILKMSFNMNPVLIEREWILAKIKKVESMLSGRNASTDPYGYMDALYGGGSITRRADGKHVVVLNRPRVSIYLLSILELYPDFRPLRAVYFRNYQRKDRYIEQAVEKLKQARDPRTQRSRFKLQPADNQWLARTWIASYLNDQHQLLRKVSQEVQTRVKAEEEQL